MKYEYLKGSEKAFDGEDDRVVVLFSVDNKDGIFRSVNPSNDDFPKGWNLIAERRPITEPELEIEYVKYNGFDSINQKTNEPVWSGEGLPPVGCHCEVKTGKYSWNLCKIVFSDDAAGVAFVYLGGDEEKYVGSVDCIGSVCAPSYFRSMRSPEDVARDEAIDSIQAKLLLRREVAIDFYDSIAAGEIRGVKLEGK